MMQSSFRRITQSEKSPFSIIVVLFAFVFSVSYICCNGANRTGKRRGKANSKTQKVDVQLTYEDTRIEDTQDEYVFRKKWSNYQYHRYRLIGPLLHGIANKLSGDLRLTYCDLPRPRLVQVPIEGGTDEESDQYTMQHHPDDTKWRFEAQPAFYIDIRWDWENTVYTASIPPELTRVLMFDCIHEQAIFLVDIPVEYRNHITLSHSNVLIVDDWNLFRFDPSFDIYTMHVQHGIDKEFIRCFGHTRYRYQPNVMEQMSHEYKIGPHSIEQPSEQSALESLQWCIAFGYAVLSKVLTGSFARGSENTTCIPEISPVPCIGCFRDQP